MEWVLRELKVPFDETTPQALARADLLSEPAALTLGGEGTGTSLASDEVQLVESLRLRLTGEDGDGLTAVDPGWIDVTVRPDAPPALRWADEHANTTLRRWQMLDRHLLRGVDVGVGP